MTEYVYQDKACPWLQCGCATASAPSTLAEAQTEAQQIRAELTVPARNLSATVRRRTSAPDPRPSARGVGWMGVAVAGGLLVAVFFLDLTSLKRDLRRLTSNVEGFFSRPKTEK